MTTPAPETPRYTRWEQVPAELYTRNQLWQLDPKRRIRKDVEPRAHVLYHGNRYAPLYTIDDSTVRQTPSAAQVAAAVRAGELRYICRWCEYPADELLAARICHMCDAALRSYAAHLEGRAMIAGLHCVGFRTGDYQPLYAACTYHPAKYDRWPARIVLIDPATDAIAADRQIPAPPADPDGGYVYSSDLADDIRALGGGRPIIVWEDRTPGARGTRWDYQKWQGYLHGDGPSIPEMPGTTGDLETDARALAALAAGIVTGRVQPPKPGWASRGLTPEQMRPYVGRRTTRDVLNAIAASTP